VNHHRQLLKLAACNNADMCRLLSQWEQTADYLRLSDDDVRFAVEEWIPGQWDCDLFGVRKMLGVLLKELIKLFLPAREGTKLVYSAVPSPPSLLLAMRMAGEGKAIVAAPEVLLTVSLGAVFHKNGLLLESVEEAGLMQSGCRHCALNKIRAGLRMRGLIKMPDVTWVSGMLCDEGFKTGEYLDCLGGKQGADILIRVPQDADCTENGQDHSMRCSYLAQQIRHGLHELREYTGIEVKNSHLTAAHKRCTAYVFKLATLTSLVARSNPPPLGAFETALFGLPLVMPLNHGLEEAEDALDTVISEVRHRRSQRNKIVSRGVPRLLAYQVPYAQPWISRLFEQGNAPIVGSLTAMMGSRKSSLAHSDDRLLHICDAWLKEPPQIGLCAEVEAISDLVQRYHPDALVMGLLDFDRKLGVHQRLLANSVQERTGVPSFYIEGDLWDEREYNRENMRTRIESICQIINQGRIRWNNV
jgi:hypothetical protein